MCSYNKQYLWEKTSFSPLTGAKKLKIARSILLQLLKEKLQLCYPQLFLYLKNTPPVQLQIASQVSRKENTKPVKF